MMRRIGRGRGATVYLKDGKACKVFNGSFLAGIINTICIGVPNPYRTDIVAGLTVEEFNNLL